MPPRAKPRAITSTASSVHIEGLRDFNRALKKMGEDYPKTLRQANFDLANEVVERAQRRALSQGGITPRAAKSLRAYRSSNQAVVAGGGSRHPWFFGAEFGAKRYRQFQEWRGNQWEGWDGGPGYFLHPTIREEARELINEYMKRLDELADEAFPSG